MNTDGDGPARALASPVVPVFQPILDLDTMSVVGYEALSRWPAVPEVSPLDVFAHARSIGQMSELDWACRRAAVVASLDAGLTRPLSVFINVEPTALRSSPTWHFPGERFREITSSDLQIVIELTERDVLADPAAVMSTIDWARDRDCAIALDDVGPNPESLALLPLVLPDVVKLDRRIMTSAMSKEFDETVSFVIDYAASTGARILAEGIEDPVDLDVARTVGATLGQGYLLGVPAPPPALPPSVDPAIALQPIGPGSPSIESPADILNRLPAQVATYSTIMAVFAAITSLGEELLSPGFLVVAVQNPESWNEMWRHQYRDFAQKHTLVGVVGAGAVSIPGVREPLLPGDSFPGEFAIAILNQQYAATVVARDLGDDGPLGDRRYAWCYTHDRAAVRDVARCIVSRLAPLPTPAPTEVPLG